MFEAPAAVSAGVERLEVEGLRKIRRARLEAAEGVNWIVGPNAAGKTTILEALYLLSRGKSFRGAKHGPLVSAGLDGLAVRGRLTGGGRVRQIEFQREKGQTAWSENGVRKAGLADLSVRLHVRLIGENSQKLLEGDPELRRLFLDWNLFHVEPGYGELLASFRRVRAQRNAWLRSGGRGRPVWDAPYAELAKSVTHHRRRFVLDLQGELNEVAAGLGMGDPPRIEFVQGWPGGEDGLLDLLPQHRASDLRLGFTYLGPSRADMQIAADSGVKGLPSRGELKLMVAVLQLAAQRLWGRSGVSCVWLVDDLAAELDSESLQRVWGGLSGTGLQAFATSLGPPIAPGCVFHVEQGRITRTDA